MRHLKLFLIAKVCYDVEDAFTTPAYQSLQDFLLPSHHHFTTLVNLHANVVEFYSGINTTLMALCQKYWILKSILRQCVVCKKICGQQCSIPDPTPLVKSRISLSDPFTITGVDFTGALYRASKNGPVEGQFFSSQNEIHFYKK